MSSKNANFLSQEENIERIKKEIKKDSQIKFHALKIRLFCEALNTKEQRKLPIEKQSFGCRLINGTL